MERLNDYWLECRRCGARMISTEEYECYCDQSEQRKQEELKFDEIFQQLKKQYDQLFRNLADL